MLVRIKDEELASLRKVADLKPREENPFRWPEVGEVQKIVSGAFQGLVCTVKGRTQRHCLVEVDSRHMGLLKIPPFLLAKVEA
jgi:hypothetical protein